MDKRIKTVTDSERDWVLEVVRSWGADFVISKGRKIFPAEIEGFYAVDLKDEKLGLLTYEISNGQCEVVTLDAFKQFQGIGTALMNKVNEIVQNRGCMRLWLITTNDNLDAIRFYQKRGFTISALHKGALEFSRMLKPSIPVIGRYGIPMRDEIEFEMILK